MVAILFRPRWVNILIFTYLSELLFPLYISILSIDYKINVINRYALIPWHHLQRKIYWYAKIEMRIINNSYHCYLVFRIVENINLWPASAELWQKSQITKNYSSSYSPQAKPIFVALRWLVMRFITSQSTRKSAICQKVSFFRLSARTSSYDCIIEDLGRESIHDYVFPQIGPLMRIACPYHDSCWNSRITKLPLVDCFGLVSVQNVDRPLQKSPNIFVVIYQAFGGWFTWYFRSLILSWRV